MPEPGLSPRAQEWTERREKRNRRWKIVKEFLERNPVQPEDHIQQPMHPDCKVVVAIPAYDESPETLLHLIHSLSNQKEVTKDQFEAIIIVNNSKAAAEQNTDAYQQNQRTLKFLQALSSGEAPKMKTDLENVIVQYILDSGVRIHVMDKSSAELAFEPECNVGIARHAVGTEATYRFFQQQNMDGILFMTDSDCIVEPSVIADTIHTLTADVIVEGGTTDIIVDYPETEQGIQSKTYAHITYFLEDSVNQLLRLQEPREKTLHKEPLKHLGGARMVSRMDAFAAVDGIPRISGGEDTLFGILLSRIGKLTYMKNEQGIMPRVRTQARISNRTHAEHGFGWKISEQVQAIQQQEVRCESFDFLRARYALRTSLKKKVSYQRLMQRMPELGSVIDESVYTHMQKLYEHSDLKHNDYVSYNQQEVVPRLEAAFPPQPLQQVIGTIEQCTFEQVGADAEEVKRLQQQSIQETNQHRADRRRYIELIKEFEETVLPTLKAPEKPAQEVIQNTADALYRFMEPHLDILHHQKETFLRMYREEPARFFVVFFAFFASELDAVDYDVDRALNRFMLRYDPNPALLPDSQLRDAYLRSAGLNEALEKWVQQKEKRGEKA